MPSPIQFTTVVAVDRQHLEELAVVWPTWRRFKPEIFENPLLAFFDAEQVDLNDLRWIHNSHPRCKFVRWRDPAAKSQREKMLNAFVNRLIVEHAKTPWILKIDTDCIATGNGMWIDGSWFAPDPLTLRIPAYIASRWNYSKPATIIDDLDAWAETKREFDGTPAIDREIVGNKVVHPRAISWLQFINKGWLAFVSDLIEDRLPVPSQDTTLCYIAERLGYHTRHVRMSRYGWKHVGVRGSGGLARLQRIASEVLA